MNIKWKETRGKRCVSWTQTSLGKEDSARAPRINILTGGGLGLRPLIDPLAPVRGG